jgi:N-acyl homoserine lactone hydrolase
MSDYSIWMVEYARVDEYPVGALLYGAHNAGTRVLPFTYAVLQSKDHTVLVDVGLGWNDFTKEMAGVYGIVGWAGPETILARVGIAPEDVDTIILTHHHFDHVTALGSFPNAEVVIQRRELQSFMDKLGTPPRLSWLAGGLDPCTPGLFAKVASEGRMRIVDGPADILPGLSVRPAFDTHTAGSQYVMVSTSEGGPRILSGDAVLVYENLLGFDGDGVLVPIGLGQGGQERSVRVMDEMLTLVDDDVYRIVPNHDVALWERFPSVAYDDGHHVAEISLADGAESRLRQPAKSGIASA